MSVISIFGLLTIVAWVLTHLFVVGVIAYLVLTFWKFIVTMVLYGIIAFIIILGGVVLLL